jgi:hypothetical protein
VYFAPDTFAPITLLELGIISQSKEPNEIPEGFYRKGNVDVVCERYGIPQFGTLDSVLAELSE